MFSLSLRVNVLYIYPPLPPLNFLRAHLHVWSVVSDGNMLDKNESNVGPNEKKKNVWSHFSTLGLTFCVVFAANKEHPTVLASSWSPARKQTAADSPVRPPALSSLLNREGEETFTSSCLKLARKRSRACLWWAEWLSWTGRCQRLPPFSSPSTCPRRCRSRATSPGLVCAKKIVV